MLRLIWQRKEQKKSKVKLKNKQTSGGEIRRLFFLYNPQDENNSFNRETNILHFCI